MPEYIDRRNGLLGEWLGPAPEGTKTCGASTYGPDDIAWACTASAGHSTSAMHESWTSDQLLSERVFPHIPRGVTMVMPVVAWNHERFVSYGLVVRMIDHDQ